MSKEIDLLSIINNKIIGLSSYKVNYIFCLFNIFSLIDDSALPTSSHSQSINTVFIYLI